MLTFLVTWLLVSCVVGPAVGTFMWKGLGDEPQRK